MMLEVSAGPLARGDLDPRPHIGYLQVEVQPRDVASAPEAHFGNGVQLLGHSIEAIDERHWRLRTLWQSDGAAQADETFFVHLLLSNQLVTSNDGDSGGGLYSMRAWRRGDVIIDERTLDVPPGADRVKLLIEMGIYNRVTGQRVKVLDTAQAVINDAVLLGGPNAIGP
jgi:hypothetical protein